jgi:hypothetical protein
VKRDEDWLDEMMDAALADPSPAEPDFNAVRLASGAGASDTLPRRVRRTAAVAALAALAAAAALILAVPLAYRIGRESAARRAVREDTDLFVEELIGENLFEEGLTTDNDWTADLFEDDGFFDT